MIKEVALGAKLIKPPEVVSEKVLWKGILNRWGKNVSLSLRGPFPK